MKKKTEDVTNRKKYDRIIIEDRQKEEEDRSERRAKRK